MDTDDTKTYHSYEDHWVPGDYLHHYYSQVNADEQHTIQFFVNAMSKSTKLGDVLYFGCGPTLHHVFLATPKASAIDLADYMPNNIDELQKWIDKDPKAHDWTEFVRYTLECEGISNPSVEDISKRQELVRGLVRDLIPNADVKKEAPLGEEGKGRYQAVISAYCADAVTADKKEWEGYMRNIASMVAPGGDFIVSALRETSSYIVNGKIFPCANINKGDMERVLGLDCVRDSIQVVEVSDLGEQEELGYTGIILAHGIKAS